MLSINPIRDQKSPCHLAEKDRFSKAYGIKKGTTQGQTSNASWSQIKEKKGLTKRFHKRNTIFFSFFVLNHFVNSAIYFLQGGYSRIRCNTLRFFLARQGTFKLEAQRIERIILPLLFLMMLHRKMTFLVACQTLPPKS